MFNYQFIHPYFFWLLLIVPAFIAWRWYKFYSEKAAITLSNSGAIQSETVSWRIRSRIVLDVLRCIAFILIVFGLARPQSNSETQEVNTEGIDIVLSMDISGSMLAEDFRPNRIEAAKKLAMKFIDQRPNDRIGLVIFSGESFTQCPITSDHTVLKNLFKDIKSGMIEDGTAIGMGLATAVDRLRESKAKSKVVILMTDGVNNAGFIDPTTGFELAKTYGIRIYTIGIGTMGYAPYPIQTPFGIQYQNMPVQIDEPLMKKIATETGGEYFRATGNSRLEMVYDKIDQLEKTKIKVTAFKHHAEKFLPFAIMAALSLLLEIILRYTIYKTFP